MERQLIFKRLSEYKNNFLRSIRNMISSRECISKMVEKYDWLGKEYCRLIGNENPYKSNQLVFEEMANKVLQDLDRLEELEKVIDILKNKKVNLFHIWVYNNYEQYKEHYPFSEYHAIEDMLTLEEFDLLKEVLESE